MIQAKHKTWIPEDDLKPVWRIDVSNATWLAWRTREKGCRYLRGEQVEYQIKEVTMPGSGSGRFRTIEYLGKHVREISRKMEEERKKLRAKHPSVEFNGSVDDLPAKYKRGGTGAPIFTPDLKDYGFPTKPNGSVDAPEYWRDKSCPHLGGERLDGALLYVDVGDGWRGTPWRWVWCESHVLRIGQALKLKTQEIEKLIKSGEIIPNEELIPKECRENQRADGSPWFTDRVAEYLKLAERFGKDDPADTLYPWRFRCYYLPNKRRLRCLTMRNGRLVWFDEDVQLLHNRFSKRPPRGRIYDETTLPTDYREGGRVDGTPLRVGMIEKLAGRKFNFGWLIRTTAHLG